MSILSPEFPSPEFPTGGGQQTVVDPKATNVDEIFKEKVNTPIIKNDNILNIKPIIDKIKDNNYKNEILIRPNMENIEKELADKAIVNKIKEYKVSSSGINLEDSKLMKTITNEFEKKYPNRDTNLKIENKLKNEIDKKSTFDNSSRIINKLNKSDVTDGKKIETFFDSLGDIFND